MNEISCQPKPHSMDVVNNKAFFVKIKFATISFDFSFLVVFSLTYFEIILFFLISHVKSSSIVVFRKMETFLKCILLASV